VIAGSRLPEAPSCKNVFIVEGGEWEGWGLAPRGGGLAPVQNLQNTRVPPSGTASIELARYFYPRMQLRMQKMQQNNSRLTNPWGYRGPLGSAPSGPQARDPQGHGPRANPKKAITLLCRSNSGPSRQAHLGHPCGRVGRFCILPCKRRNRCLAW
jgi:hypothetical protein